MAQIILVLGGSRSGKSRFAQNLAGHAQARHSVLYWATGIASDREMKRRIAAHKDSRPGNWKLLEEPRDLRRGLQSVARLRPDRVLMDSLTAWAGNMLHKPLGGKDPLQELRYFLTRIKTAPCRWIIVSDEVGMGIVPGTPASREFRDLLGDINQSVAQAADQVHCLIAGIPVRIKPS